MILQQDIAHEHKNRGHPTRSPLRAAGGGRPWGTDDDSVNVNLCL